jgi:signal transduction histidine kinase/ActR/RegA family two-component response regulator
MKSKPQLFLTGLLLAAFMAGMVVVNYKSISALALAQADFEQTLTSVNRAKTEGLQAQINFKIQVQEWKNVLIRGDDAEDFDRYWKQFKEQETHVQANLANLRSYAELHYPELIEQVLALVIEHLRLGEAYRNALQLYDPEDPASHRKVDTRVRGIDRKPQQDMDAVTREINLHGEAALEEAHTRVQEARAKSVRNSLFLVFGGILVTGLLLWKIYLNENRLESRTREAVKANQAKSFFLANMSHEIRTPLNGVIGMMDILKSTQLDARQREQLGIAQTSAGLLLALLNDILDYSKIEAGRIDLEPVPTDIRAIVDSVVQLFLPKAIDKGIEFSATYAPGLPVAIRVDPLRLRQALLNLAHNALKFTEKGTVHIHASWSDPEAEGLKGVFFISVRDTGVGISKEKLHFLFETFYQVEREGKSSEEGTGLGLAISRRLIELMEGKLSVESEEGHGSTFTISFPAEKVSAEESLSEIDEIRQAVFANPAVEEETLALKALAREDNSSPVEHCRLSVLVAEDNPVNQTVTRHLLQQMGIEPEIVVNGEEAVTAYKKGRHDVILMDIQMPVLNGIEATRQIRSFTGNSEVPWIVALTAGALQENKEQAFEAGLNDYLVKPVTPDLIQEKLYTLQTRPRLKTSNV